MPTLTQNVIGRKYGKLTVFQEVEKNPHGKRQFICRCECGGSRKVNLGCLNSGYTNSCGCLRRQQARLNCPPKHGKSNSPVFHVWRSMKSRCYNPKNASYLHYGARGIKVCDRWMNFQNFLEDMGEPKKGLSLDRINNNGNYEPSNCKWSNWNQQARNRSNNRRITHKGKTQTLVEWCEELGLNFATVSGRLYFGQTEEQALLPRHQGLTVEEFLK
jgi:hypothetical protein